MILEIAVGDIDSALSAATSGADRLELCSALELGGLTPTVGAMKTLLPDISVPVIALLRPRPGGFVYTSAEWKCMRADADALLTAGVSGIATGVLMPDGTVDRNRIQELARTCPHADLVFHRAFDWTPNPLESLTLLTDVGVRRILSSGGKSTAVEGSGMLSAMRRSAGASLEILAGGGIRANNVVPILSATGIHQVHASCTRIQSGGDPFSLAPTLVFQPEEVSNLRAELDAWVRTHP